MLRPPRKRRAAWIDYLPFGEQIAGSSDTTHKFTGYERLPAVAGDSESNLDNAQARYFSSTLGRFMSPDLAGGHFMNPQSLNRYAYVHNNPLSFIDPFGLDCVSVNTAGQVNDWGYALDENACGNANNIGNGSEYFYVQGSVDSYSWDSSGDLEINYTVSNGFGSFGTSGTYNPAAGIFSDSYGNTFDANSYSNGSNITDIFHCPGCANIWNSTAAGMNQITKYYLYLYGGLITGGAGTEYGPAMAESLSEAGKTTGAVLQNIILDPQNVQIAYDILNGYAPGTIPATAGGLTGATVSYIQSNWNQLSDESNVTLRPKMGVPH